MTDCTNHLYESKNLTRGSLFSLVKMSTCAMCPICLGHKRVFEIGDFVTPPTSDPRKIIMGLENDDKRKIKLVRTSHCYLCHRC